MRQINVSLGQRSYPILIGPGLLGRAAERLSALPVKRWAVVADETAASLYAGSLGLPVYTFPAGEGSKCLAVYESLCRRMLADGFTRADGIVALGGGVAGDLAGFLAGTILRGVPLVQMPTTLLAQVDSSVGGKVAVDLEYGKNLAGAFWQPRLVLMDPEVLDTLPLPVFMEGMAEVVKYGCIKDAAFFDFLAARPSRAELMAEMEHILYTCCAIKRSVVEQDERDTGERMLLNFGHTLGHAYELAGHYTEWSHGAAVAAGMCAAARLGVRLGVTPAELPERLEEALSALGLPTAIPCTAEDYAAAVGLDKKGAGEDISVILLERMGRAVPHRMPKAKLLEELR